MRYVRFGEKGAERPGVLDAEDNIRDLSGIIDDVSGDVLAQLPAVDPSDLPLVSGTPRLGVPVAGIGKLVCIGLNYSDHAAELGVEPPEEPVVFMKATSSITGPYDDVVLPRSSQKGDWEVELGIVISRHTAYVTQEQAMQHVAGFTIVNDVSEREFQLERGGQWTKGKSCDTFGPIGPWLVTPDEIDDVHALEMGLSVNGEQMQTGTTANMIFGVSRIIANLSEVMSLQPGDVIATGTPPGVGVGQTPKRFLNEGDRMDLWIERLGRQSQLVSRAR